MLDWLNGESMHDSALHPIIRCLLIENNDDLEDKEGEDDEKEDEKKHDADEWKARLRKAWF